jgi:hypothetical protein
MSPRSYLTVIDCMLARQHRLATNLLKTLLVPRSINLTRSQPKITQIRAITSTPKLTKNLYMGDNIVK